MKISIIIPVYNVKQYLSATLENVLSQEFEDFELILVDDGSTDGSEKICDRFAIRDTRVRVIHQVNAGVSAARNTGVAAANGEYIGFVDSDDLIEPNMFAVMTELAEEYDADIVQCRHNRIDRITYTKPQKDIRVITGHTFVEEMFSYTGGEYTNQVALWSKIYRRYLFDMIHFPEGRTYEDEQETYKLCLQAKRIVLISDKLYHYVKRENSIITGISANKMLDKQFALMDRLYYLPKRLPDLWSQCATAFLNYSKQIMVVLYSENEDCYTKAKENLLVCRKDIMHYANKYDRLYLFLIQHGMGEKWVMTHSFSPIQDCLSRIRK